MIRLGRITIAAACLSLMAAPALAQAGPPGGAPPAAADPNRILAELSNVAQITAAAKKCNWTDPMYVLASESMLAIKAADLKATVAPEVRGQVDTALAQAAASVSSFACKQPDGKDPPQQHQITMFVMDQYWRMIAHVDVLGSLRWGEVFRYTPEERKALDKEIAHIQEFKGYSYYEAANPLETLADKTITLACRERPSNGKPCRPVPPELEGNAPTIRTMIETVETFGKAVAAEEIRVKQAFLASVGDITAFSAIGDKACTRDALVVKVGDALTKTKVTDDTSGAMTQEVKFVEKFRLGMPERIGWVLLFRSMMYANDNPPYMVLAENGGEWDEESARNGAGQVNTLSDAIIDSIESQDLPAPLKDAAMADARTIVADTLFDNFVMMGLMQSINGSGGVTLKPCTAD
jgi:hypothetical protein